MAVLTFNLSIKGISNYARNATINRKVGVPLLDGVPLAYSATREEGDTDESVKADLRAQLTADGIVWASEA